MRQSVALRSAIAAATIGGLVGAAAALWSLRGWPSRSPAPAQVPIVEAVDASPEPLPSPPPLAGAEPRPADPPPSSPPRDAGGAQALRRARELAGRADVRGLLAVREDLVRRADARGVEEVDRYLSEARELRLRLDREEFRRDAGAQSP